MLIYLKTLHFLILIESYNYAAVFENTSFTSEIPTKKSLDCAINKQKNKFWNTVLQLELCALNIAPPFIVRIRQGGYLDASCHCHATLTVHKK